MMLTLVILTVCECDCECSLRYYIAIQHEAAGDEVFLDLAGEAG